MNDYEKQAADFVAATGLKIEKKYLGHRTYFDSDKEQRAVWEITFRREDKSPDARWAHKPSHTFKFGQSIANSYTLHKWSGMKAKIPFGIHSARGYQEACAAGGGDIYLKGDSFTLRPAKTPPTDYDVLTCVEKYAPETFEDFCAEYGYDTDSRKALDTFLVVQAQSAAIRRMFTPAELEQLQEIT